MTKKLLLAFFLLLIPFCLTACGGEKEPQQEKVVKEELSTDRIQSIGVISGNVSQSMFAAAEQVQNCSQQECFVKAFQTPLDGLNEFDSELAEAEEEVEGPCLQALQEERVATDALAESIEAFSSAGNEDALYKAALLFQSEAEDFTDASDNFRVECLENAS